MKASLVFTTINIPHICNDYWQNLKKFGNETKVEVIIIGDLKTPHTAAFSIVQKLKSQGFAIEYFDIALQEKWMQKYPRLKKIIPYNNDSRRNIGFLMALERKRQFLISIDDDSFPMNEDYYGLHTIVGTTKNLPVVSSTNGWFNPCSMLENDREQYIYARGFPYSKRNQKTALTKKNKKIRIGVNAGLWLNEPDVDAFARLAIPVKITGLKQKQIALDKDCYAPINTQNTALVYDLIPAFYFVLMEGTINHLPLSRFGDIWTGWFLKKIADHLGYYVSFGEPLTDHRRNKHDLFNDLYIELTPLKHNDAFVELIQLITPKGKTTIDVYSDISKKLHDEIQKNNTFKGEFKKYSQTLYEHQQIWLETCDKIIS